MLTTFHEYQVEVGKLAFYPKDVGVQYCALGLAGEAGEVCNELKKVLRDDGGKLGPRRHGRIAYEIGDCMWYAAQLAAESKYSMSVLAKLALDPHAAAVLDNMYYAGGQMYSDGDCIGFKEFQTRAYEMVEGDAKPSDANMFALVMFAVAGRVADTVSDMEMLRASNVPVGEQSVYAMMLKAQLAARLAGFTFSASCLCSSLEMDLQDVINKNIYKLQARQREREAKKKPK